MFPFALHDNHNIRAIHFRIIPVRTAQYGISRCTNRSITGRILKRGQVLSLPSPPCCSPLQIYSSFPVYLRPSRASDLRLRLLDWNSDKAMVAGRAQPLPLLDHCLQTVNSPLGTSTRLSEVWSLSWKRKPSPSLQRLSAPLRPLFWSLFTGAHVLHLSLSLVPFLHPLPRRFPPLYLSLPYSPLPFLSG